MNSNIPEKLVELISGWDFGVHAGKLGGLSLFPFSGALGTELINMLLTIIMYQLTTL